MISDLFDYQWNVHRIRTLHLEPPTCVLDTLMHFGISMEQNLKVNYPSLIKAS